MDDPAGVGGDVGVVGNDDDGLAPFVRPGQDVHDLFGGAAVELARGLVGQKELRVVDEGPADGHALLLAARELGRAELHPLLEPDELQQFGGPVADVVLLLFPVERGHEDVFEHGGVRQEVEALKDEADVLVAQLRELVVVELHHVPAGEDETARGGDVQAAHEVHQRRFPGPGGPHDGREFALLDREVDPLEDLQILVPHVEALGDILHDADGGGHYLRAPFCWACGSVVTGRTIFVASVSPSFAPERISVLSSPRIPILIASFSTLFFPVTR